MYEKEKKFLEKIIVKAYNTQIKNHARSATIKENQHFNRDVVTSCDIGSEKYIISQIKKYFPNDNIVSEESNAHNIAKGRCWIIDPLDGTVNFANNIDIYCIQVAFLVEGNCVLSAIYCPTIDKLFVADETGAFINGKRFETKQIDDTKNAIVTTCDYINKDKYLLDAQLKLVRYMNTQFEKVRCLGSAGYEFALVATGKTNAFVSFSFNLWDIEPGLFLCKMAGCEIEKIKHDDMYIAFACTNDKIKKIVLKGLKECMKK